MAGPKIDSIRKRKARLAMESDTLRYHLQLQCNDLAPSAGAFVRGLQLSRFGVSFFRFSAPWRKAPKGRKLFSIPRVLFRLLRTP